MSKLSQWTVFYKWRGMTLLVLLLLSPLFILAQLTGKVVRILDGDTFVLLTQDTMQVKVRLYGIDCPEKKQPFGQKAKQFTSDMIFGKQVKVDEKGKDRYGRLIGMTYINGKCLNEELLKSGLAWHYVQYDKNNPKWEALQAKAKSQKVGLWCEKDCVAPWEWRKGKTANATFNR